MGTPLKEWKISINYGIKTGYNDAFIINGDKRNELIEKDPKSAEIIRPILRGRDIKKYNYELADLWLINTHNGIKEKGIKPIKIEDYPAIKQYLDGYFSQLKKRADKGVTPYNLRNCAYMEDFSKQKIIYIEIMTDNPQEGYEFPCFSFDTENCVVLNTAYVMTGDVRELKYILGVLNSKLGKQLVKFYVVQLQKRQFRMLNQYVSNFPIPKLNNDNYNEFALIVDNILENVRLKKDTKQLEKIIDSKICSIIGLDVEEIDFIDSQ